MYKLVTNFSFFRFNSSVNNGSLHVSWFALDEEEEGGRCFTYDELQVFEQFTINHPNNFEGPKNYHSCDKSEAPYLGTYSSIPNDNQNFPTKIILRSQPKLSSSMSDCMDVILTDKNGTDNHKYDLPFIVVGRLVL